MKYQFDLLKFTVGRLGFRLTVILSKNTKIWNEGIPGCTVGWLDIGD